MISTEAAIKEGRFHFFSESGRQTVSDMIARYIECELPKKPKSLLKQTAQLKWWEGQIGHLFISRVTPAILVECRDRLSAETTCRGEKRSPATTNRYLAVMAHCFSVACKEWQWLDDSPMRHVSKLKEPRGRDRILTDKEMYRLFEACQQSKNPYLYTVVRVALGTGMRQGEILGLVWKNVYFPESKIILRDTKNGRIRAVHLAPEIKELLEEIGKNRRLDTFFVFPSHDGLQPASIRTAWENALQLAEIKDFRFHDLRHTAASMMAMNGASDAELRAFLGHLSPSQTVRYAHYRDSEMEVSVNRLSEKIANAHNH
ncbi:MAG: site-specific integrase [Waddliaceae bacterium]